MERVLKGIPPPAKSILKKSEARPQKKFSSWSKTSQRDVQPLFAKVGFEEVGVDDPSYFAGQPPTIIVIISLASLKFSF